MSEGDSFLFAFSDVGNAVKCSLSIQDSLAVRQPITLQPLGHLRVRMAIHAGARTTKAGMAEVLGVASRIASKAQEGRILISGGARHLVTVDPENVRFLSKEEKLELASGNRGPTEEELFEVVQITPVVLEPEERGALSKQDPGSKSGGGFQAFLVSLQGKVDTATGRIELTVNDRERIARYAHDYRGGGWQGRLKRIFGRTLGSNLGREGC